MAALLPIGRLAIGRWAGLTAIALCLMTGYFYGSLFFTPIDVPFLAAMTWATLAIVMMTREVLPSWRATAVVGLLTGLAIATRTGGIITHAYLLGAMLLCAAEFWTRHGRLTLPYIVQMGARYAAVVVHRVDHRDCALAMATDRQSMGAIQGRARTLRDHSDGV